MEDLGTCVDGTPCTGTGCTEDCGTPKAVEDDFDPKFEGDLDVRGGRYGTIHIDRLTDDDLDTLVGALGMIELIARAALHKAADDDMEYDGG
jgi:hypothetical protein